jgi:hypothetical protein
MVAARLLLDDQPEKAARDGVNDQPRSSARSATKAITWLQLEITGSASSRLIETRTSR